MSDEHGTVRSRTFTWQDPDVTARAARTMSGLELLKAIVAGELAQPPIGSLMGFRLSEAEEGRAVFTMEPAEYHYNPVGAVHGGVAATLLDSAMACALFTLLPQGTASTTLEIKVNYIRPMTRATGLVRCEGTVIHVGSTIATAEGRITGADGKLYAHATTTCLIMRS